MRRWIPLLLVASGLLAYHNGLLGPFILDDIVPIRENSHIRHLWPIWEAMSAPRGCPVDGRPIVCLTLALNYALGGLNVWGYHAFNLAVHIVNALLLFGIVGRTLENHRLHDRYRHQARWISLAIALIWLVHPLQTEGVAYTVQRTELLMGMFLLLTLYCLVCGSQSSHSKVWYASAIVACALGMGSKEVMVVAPLVVMLYDRVFLTSSLHDLWRQRRGLYIGLASTWLVLAWLVTNTPHAMTGFGLQSLSTWDYLKTEATVIVHYLRLCFWPSPLVVDYSDWPVAGELSSVMADAFLVVVLLGGTIWTLRYHPPLGFLSVWFFLILAPTSSILPSAGEMAAERRMYLPLAAVVILVVLSVHELLRVIIPSGRQGPRTGRALESVLVIGALLALAAVTVRRNEDYRTAVSIWKDTVNKRPGNARAHQHLGYALMAEGNWQEAITHFEQALQINPEDSDAHNNLGIVQTQAGRMHEAIQQFEQALQIKPDSAEGHCNLGNALLQMHRVQDAIGHYQQAVHLRLDFAEAHQGLGMALATKGHTQEAISEYLQALRFRPDYPEALNNLGLALANQGKLDEATSQLEAALRLNPRYTEVHYTLALVLVKRGHNDEAISHLQSALQLEPGSERYRRAILELQPTMSRSQAH